MSDTPPTPEATDADATITVIQVPEAHAAKVMEYVKTLQQEPDVAGYAYRLPWSAVTTTGTGCSHTGMGSDWACADTDN